MSIGPRRSSKSRLRSSMEWRQRARGPAMDWSGTRTRCGATGWRERRLLLVLPLLHLRVVDLLVELLALPEEDAHHEDVAEHDQRADGQRDHHDMMVHA